MPGLWLHWDGSLIDFYVCSLVVGLAIFFGCLCPGCGRGVWFVSPLPEMCLVGVHVPVCGGLVCVLFLVCPVCGLGLYGWVACWHMLDLCIGLMPFSYIFRGGVVRFSVFLGALASCIVCGALPFLEINS